MGKSLYFVGRIKLKFCFWLYKIRWHTSWKFQLEITCNIKVIAKKPLTKLYEMNSKPMMTWKRNIRGLSIKYVDFSHNSVIFQYFETKFLWRIIAIFLELWCKFGINAKHIIIYTKLNNITTLHPAHGITSLTTLWRRFKFLSWTLPSVYQTIIRNVTSPFDVIHKVSVW